MLKLFNEQTLLQKLNPHMRAGYQLVYLIKREVQI